MSIEDFRGQHALGRAEVTRAWVRGETGTHGRSWRAPWGPGPGCHCPDGDGAEHLAGCPERVDDEYTALPAGECRVCGSGTDTLNGLCGPCEDPLGHLGDDSHLDEDQHSSRVGR